MTSPPVAAEPVAAVVPTLDRLATLRECLDAAAAQTRPLDLTLVVDNGSTDGTREHLARREEVRPVLMESNAGAPGGFAAGIEAAADAGAAWVWLLDDDCVPAPGALAALVAAAEAGGADAGGCAPTVEFGDGRRETGWMWGRRAAGGHGQSPAPADAPDVDWAPFAGLFLRVEACRDAGPIRADYMLWHADVEYCLRLRRGGWRLLAVPAAEVRHPAMPLIERRVAGRKVAVGDIAPWREYYDTRNRVLLDRALRGSGFERGTSLPRRWAAEAARDAAVLVADPAGPRRVLMRLLGWFDGVRGRRDRHPEARAA